jgi:hypothetical protein
MYLLLIRFLLCTIYFSKAFSLLNGECNDQECPSSQDVHSTDDDNITIDDSCSIYLSRSSIPGGGMGIFASKKFQKGDIILEADGPNIPIIDPYQSTYAKSHWRLFESYWWGQGSSLSPEMRFEAHNVADYQITFGYVIYSLIYTFINPSLDSTSTQITAVSALPNFHTFLHNLGFIFPEKTYNDSMCLGNVPGCGAYSYHTGRTFYAARDIEAGEELFLDYGETYLEARSYLDHVPRKQDFLQAGEILSNIVHSLDIENYRNEDKSNRSSLGNNCSDTRRHTFNSLIFQFGRLFSDQEFNCLPE